MGETAPFATLAGQYLGGIVKPFLLNPDKIGTPRTPVSELQFVIHGTFFGANP